MFNYGSVQQIYRYTATEETRLLNTIISRIKDTESRKGNIMTTDVQHRDSKRRKTFLKEGVRKREHESKANTTQVAVHAVHSIYECFNKQQPVAARAPPPSLAQHQTPSQAHQMADCPFPCSQPVDEFGVYSGPESAQGVS